MNGAAGIIVLGVVLATLSCIWGALLMAVYRHVLRREWKVAAACVVMVVVSATVIVFIVV